MDLSKQHAHPEDADAELKAMAALRLRIAGRSYRQIGKALDLSHSRAYEIIIGKLQEIRTLNLEAVEELRTLELARLDDMWRRMYPPPELPNATIDPKTAIALLRIVRERRAISGLDVVVRNALPPAEVPYAGSFDLDNPALTRDDFRDLERVTMRAMGLDPALEVSAPRAGSPAPDSTASMNAPSDDVPMRYLTGAPVSESAQFGNDPDTGYPIAVELAAPRPSLTYQPE